VSESEPARRRRRVPIQLDDIDIQLLTILSEDCRTSQRALAREVGMSAPGVADRISRLEAAGIIAGYHADIDWSALDLLMTVVIDVISDRSTTQLELAHKLVQEIPEVERIDVLTGGKDLQLRLRVRDQEHLNEVLFDRLMTASPGIVRTDTQLALRTIEPANFDTRMLREIAVSEPDRGQSG
jgi:Lrp/AsnC family transcriptional regulator, leucine-responsive regulatory protein